MDSGDKTRHRADFRLPLFCSSHGRAAPDERTACKQTNAICGNSAGKSEEPHYEPGGAPSPRRPQVALALSYGANLGTRRGREYPRAGHGLSRAEKRLNEFTARREVVP